MGYGVEVEVGGGTYHAMDATIALVIHQTGSGVGLLLMSVGMDDTMKIMTGDAEALTVMVYSTLPKPATY